MPWTVVLAVFVVLAALTGLCIMNARMIRRDLDERFARIQARLEEEANEVFRNLRDDDKPQLPTGSAG